MFRPFLLALVLIGASSAAARQAPEREARIFLCEDGRAFSASFRPGEATVSVGGTRLRLAQRPFSFGDRYGRGEAIFIRDGDYAVLRGVPGGPFRNCRITRAEARR